LLNRIQKMLLALAGLAALALGGSALAGAANNTGTGSTSGTTTQSRPAIPQHGTATHEDQEKPVTGDAAAKAKAAAEKSVGSGSTATEVTTDFTGEGYEVTVKKADGSTVEVHLDKSFNVLKGGPGGRHDHGGRGFGPANGTAAHENAEKPVTGDAATKAKAAAEKSVGSGSTATEVTTDFTGDGYEVTVKKADGSTVEVHLDKSFDVRQGGPDGPHGHGGPGDPDGPGDNSGASLAPSDAAAVGA
jgi:uncharacterized membrane protein YkoI